MILNILKNIFEKKINKPDKKEWLDKLVENLESKLLEDATLPFRIIELKSTGFVVKVSGLYGYILFNYMPWKYSNNNYWFSISPTLTGKIFLCKIHSIKKTLGLTVIINGNIPQFKKAVLEIGKNYKCIILEKVGGGIFIDTGFHFNWHYGSFVGYLPKSQIDSEHFFPSCSIGDEIELFYQGKSEKGTLIFSQTNEIAEWNSEIPQGLVGQIVLVKVVRVDDENGVKFLVNGKYHGKMIYSQGNKRMTKSIVNNLEDGSLIHCEVISCKEKVRVLIVKWVMELDGEIIETASIPEMKMRKNSIVNNLDEETVKKLIAAQDKI